ncbi:MAG: hypothetical protein N2Z81_04220 [Hydrogenothermaceae bacterium]|nr:hypothetical protein [Hydrogenothermaceae bacterium]
MDRDFLVYISALFDNCGYLTLKKDKRTGSIYPYIKIKIKSRDILLKAKDIFGGSITKNGLILTHRKAKHFLDIILNYSSFHKDKIQLINKLYETKFSGKFEKERKEKIYREFKELERDGRTKRV